MTSEKRVNATHGVICSLPEERLGFFGWPSVTRTESGKLVAAASGPRFAHVCPWGRTVLFTSTDDGTTWSRPRILNDTPLDDRDAGIICLGGEKLLVTWFAADRRPGFRPEHVPADELAAHKTALDALTEESVQKWTGSWVRTSADGGDAWSDFFAAPANTPHGPILRVSGDLLYFGKGWVVPGKGDDESVGSICACASADEGKTWEVLGVVPTPDDVANENFHEPHVVELPSGKLVGLIRYQHRGDYDAYESFSMFQTESEDGGKTWTEAHHTGVYGSPPHVIQHSSGAIVCVYGYRREPFGERAMISRDGGATWDADWVINDAPKGDLGYPCSVEMPDGRILTVYYQHTSVENHKAALLYSIWELPE